MRPGTSPPFDYELFLMREGRKAVVLRERVPLGALPALQARWRADGWLSLFDATRAYRPGGTDDIAFRDAGDHVMCVIARDAAVAEEAMALKGAEIDVDLAGRAASLDATRRLGKLLGYPACCVEAFVSGSNTPFFPRGVTGFHLDAYHRTTGAFEPLLNRLALTPPYSSHAPCRYNCTESLALAGAIHDEVARRDARLASEHLSRSRRPIAFWSADRFAVLEGRWEAQRFVLVGVEPMGEGWRGDATQALTLLRAADALEPEVGELRLFRGGRLLATLADAEPLAAPHFFNWDGRWFPYASAPRLALVDLRATADDYLGNRLAVLAGDLRRQGVDAKFYRALVEHADSAQVDARLDRLDEALRESGVNVVVVERMLTPAWLASLRRRGVGVIVLEEGGNEAVEALDVLVPANSVALHPRVAAVTAVLGALGRRLGPLRRSAEPMPDAAGAPLRVVLDGAGARDASVVGSGAAATLPYHPVFAAEQVAGVPAPLPRHWYFEGSAGCPYARPSPAPQEVSVYVEAGGRVTTRGCSFCIAGGDYQKADVPAIAARLAAEMGHVYRHTPLRSFVVGDTFPHRYLEPLVEQLGQTGLRDVELLVQTRPDWLLKAHAQLLRVLPRLAAMGSSLVLYLVGFENFSQPELDRLNKGLTVEDNLAAIELLRALEAAHPGQFSATRYRTHGFLLFNPWTTLDDLRENAIHMGRTRFHELRTHALLTRLRLYPYLPMFHRARAEGLLVDAYSSAERSSSRRIGYAPEFPWRARDPRVERVFDVVSALHDRTPEVLHHALLGAAVEAAEASSAASADEVAQVVAARYPARLEGARAISGISESPVAGLGRPGASRRAMMLGSRSPDGLQPADVLAPSSAAPAVAASPRPRRERARDAERAFLEEVLSAPLASSAEVACTADCVLLRFRDDAGLTHILEARSGQGPAFLRGERLRYSHGPTPDGVEPHELAQRYRVLLERMRAHEALLDAWMAEVG